MEVPDNDEDCRIYCYTARVLHGAVAGWNDSGPAAADEAVRFWGVSGEHRLKKAVAANAERSVLKSST